MKIVGVLDRVENSKDYEDKYYLSAIKKFGGVPILINEYNLDMLDLCAGIVLTGGDNKGKLDDYLISYAIKNNLALLGICQGMQSMAMYDTDSKLIDVDNHYKCEHYVYLEDSKLKDIIGSDKILVNSFHHQQVSSSKAFKIIGRSSDGVVEALENSFHPFQIGVEWHPERIIEKESSQKLFKEFIDNIKTK